MVLPPQGTLFLPYKKTFLNGAESLRVGVLVDRDHPQPWVDALLAFLRQIPGIDTHVLTVAIQGPSESKKPAWLMDRLYSASRARFDPFGEVILDRGASVAPKSVDAIRAGGYGVIIWLARCQEVGVKLSNLAKHGIFTVRLGDRNRTIPFWDEVATGSATSVVTVYWHDSSFAQGRAVRNAATSTVAGLFFTMNAEQPLVATIRMLAALCLEVQRGGERFEELVRNMPSQSLDRAVPPRTPANLEAARFIARKLTRSAQMRWKTRGKTAKWFIAMRPNKGESITDSAQLNLTGFTEVPLPRGVEAMADPFLCEAAGSQFLLFEEVATGQSRGRLGCVEVLKDGSCSEMKIILERPYHLSYPCVVPRNGDLFLLPESSEAGRVDIYRFSNFPWEVELVSSPIEGVALVDTTPVFIDDHWYFFTTTIEPFMETVLFSATRLEGPWSLHPCNPVSTSVRNSRSAGQLFWRDGRLFRPTQDCSVRYGYAVAVTEVTKLTPSEFEERQVSYVPPSWRPDLLGTHTWNESSRFQVLDGKRFVSHPGEPPAT